MVCRHHLGPIHTNIPALVFRWILINIYVWLTEHACLSQFLDVILAFLITNSVLFHHDNYKYYWDVYIHGYSYWTTNLGFTETR